MLGRLGCNGRACTVRFKVVATFSYRCLATIFSPTTSHLRTHTGTDGSIPETRRQLDPREPTDADQHEGGKRMDVDSWQYRACDTGSRGAPFSASCTISRRWKSSPRDHCSSFRREEPAASHAHWEDGTIEDVTELCRFSTMTTSSPKSVKRVL